jgi:TRAP-type C4-dicarboxylate transport system permease small subunit
MSAGIGGLGALKLLGVVLIVGGVLALVYGGFSYTKSTQQAKIGPLELSIKDTETVNVPIWVGAGALAIGGILLLVRK